MNSPRFPSRPVVDDQKLYDLRWQRHALPAVTVSQEIGLLELLATGPRTAQQLCEELEIEARAVEALLAVLGGLQLASPDAKGQFKLSSMGRTYLLQDADLAVGTLQDLEHPDVALLLEAVRSRGGPVAPKAVSLGERPESTIQSFIEMMHRIVRPAATALARNPIWDDRRRLLDVGGGSGTLSLAIADRQPQLRATVMDLDQVCALCRERIVGHGLSERVGTCPGDMFSPGWPEGHDTVLFGNVFHDWEPARCKQLAWLAFDALPPGGKVMLHEMPLNEDRAGPLTVACFSVSMLMHERGKQYTPNELRGFLSEAGFQDIQVEHSFAYYWIVTGTRP